MKTVYLGMALRGAPQWWTGLFQRQVRGQLGLIAGVTVTQFVGLEPGRDNIHEQDISKTKSADVMVALTRYMLIGLGMEIQSRIERKKPTFVFHPKGLILSGMIETAPYTTVFRYESDKKDSLSQASMITAITQRCIRNMKK